uniref:Uncharacterized protein n=1 Tax=Arundo donax TaxID=35708 RepID=A0A0A9G516_ARUDO
MASPTFFLTEYNSRSSSSFSSRAVETSCR